MCKFLKIGMIFHLTVGYRIFLEEELRSKTCNSEL